MTIDPLLLFAGAIYIVPFAWVTGYLAGLYEKRFNDLEKEKKALQAQLNQCTAGGRAT